MPRIHTFDHLSLAPPRQWRLPNGMPVYAIDKGTQEVVRIEVVYLAGRPFERKALVARTAASLLKEGGGSRDGNELNQWFDYYGATLSFPYNLDTANICLYSLNRHLPRVLPAFAEMIARPHYPERELLAFIRRNQQSLREDLSKNDIIAYREITELFFGPAHPYGYNSQPETYAALERADLLEHHERLFRGGNGFLLLSGRITPEVEKLVEEHLGALPGGPAAPVPLMTANDAPPATVKIDRPGTLQTALRLGKRLCTRNHPDYAGLYVLHTIFGGYFGSRLMENIREEKGYTYNINSALDTMRYDGAFHIEAEVSNEYVAETLREIDAEMDVLREELVDDEELEMVRNYLMGTFLTMLDGPFNLSEVYRTLLTEETPFEFFGHLIDTVLQITPEQLRELARRYLEPDSFWKVIVGP